MCTVIQAIRKLLIEIKQKLGSAKKKTETNILGNAICVLWLRFIVIVTLVIYKATVFRLFLSLWLAILFVFSLLSCDLLLLCLFWCGFSFVIVLLLFCYSFISFFFHFCINIWTLLKSQVVENLCMDYKLLGIKTEINTARKIPYIE